MKRRGFTLIEIMIVVAIIALLAAVAIPNLMEARRTANTTAAKATLRNLSTAAETYAVSNSGNYPSTVAALATFAPSASQYCADGGATRQVQGYNYTCQLSASGYTFVAVPASAQSGTTTYTATTGGSLTPL